MFEQIVVGAEELAVECVFFLIDGVAGGGGLENGQSVQQTAERLGFYDAFHFSKAFKRFWGEPPCSFKPA